jgi:hypothetical protein
MRRKKAYKLRDSEKKMASTYVGCPIRHGQIQLEVCGKLQSDCRQECARMNMGNGCPHLDFTRATDAWADYQKLKAA